MQIDLWHGTNQDFTSFSAKLLGLNNANTASRAAFFLAADPETARDYARQAARKLVPNHEAHEAAVADLLAAAETARRAGRLSRYEEILMEAEQIEFGAMQAAPSGARILRCRVSFDNPFEIDANHHSVVVNLGEVLEDAKAAGYDAVILRGICDTPSGDLTDDHYAIYDSAQIEILEAFDAEAGIREEEPEGMTM